MEYGDGVSPPKATGPDHLPGATIAGKRKFGGKDVALACGDEERNLAQRVHESAIRVLLAAIAGLVTTGCGGIDDVLRGDAFIIGINTDTPSVEFVQGFTVFV
jgi:hypothetical protein